MSDAGAPPDPAGTTIFVSYAHEDAAWRDRLVAAFDRCTVRENLVLWADPEIEPGRIWGKELRNALQRARVAVCLVTRHFLASEFVREHELPALVARQREGLRLIPVIVEDCAWVSLRPLSRTQAILGETPLASLSHTELDRRLDELWLRLISLLQPEKAWEIEWPAPRAIDLEALAEPSVEMVGRKAELHELDLAWTSWETKVVTVVGGAGEGKTLLVLSWLRETERRTFGGAHRVLAWSFSRQGSPSAAGATAEAFLNAAVRAWGRADLIAHSPWRKVREIVRICRAERCLLVLDGTEVLQDPRHATRGTISDIALSRLIAELARRQLGLLAITSREPVPGLPVESTVTIAIDELEDYDARQLIRAGCPATADEDLDALTERWGRNALTLRLVAGAASMGRELPAPLSDAGAPTRLEQALSAVHDDLDARDVGLLRALSLFDGAAGVNSLRVAFPESPISEDSAALGHEVLQKLGLVYRSGREQNLEIHPEVRAYARRRFVSERTADWLAANERLFRQALVSAPTRIADAAEAVPLHDAMAYGARAGMHQEMLDEVYWRRLLCGKAQDSEATWRRFGTIGADLAGLTELFEVPWTKLSPRIVSRDRPFVFGQVAMYLGMLGRLDEAITPARTALAEESNPENASVIAGNLSHTLLLRGELDAAADSARQSVADARRARARGEVIISLTHLAQVLLAKNSLQAALEACEEAETEQRQATGTIFLYGGIGLTYNEVLLAHGQWSEVATRARKAIVNASAAVESDHCMLGVALLQGFRETGRTSLDEAHRHLDTAVELARERREIDMLPRPLLARAELYSFRGEGASAEDDLDEALDLTGSCGMRLFYVDALILRARRELGSGDGAAASNTCSLATKMAGETGYALRGEVLRRLTQRARIMT